MVTKRHYSIAFPISAVFMRMFNRLSQSQSTNQRLNWGRIIDWQYPHMRDTKPKPVLICLDYIYLTTNAFFQRHFFFNLKVRAITAIASINDNKNVKFYSLEEQAF